ncbi:MAG: glycosyltransferase family 4 protein [Chloroflexi bacterium]|nr:glycosyltransferase family 4 protein [Chloroflexota bacterium]
MKKKRTLAILTLDFLPNMGGMQQYIFEMAQRLTAVYHVILITPTKGTLPKETTFQRIIIKKATPWAFWQQLQKIKPDKVLLGHAHPRLLLAAVMQGNYATITYGNDYLAAQLQWHRPLFNFLLKRSHPLITISQANARRLQELGFPPPHTIRPGTHPNRFTPAATSESKLPTLLTICRLVPRKGIDTVLNAMPQLLESFPDLHYHIGGHGPDLNRLQQLVEMLDIGHAVTFLGFIPDENLPAVYQQANIFIMPVREEKKQGSMEGFGIVYLEASASGLPVIGGKSGGTSDAIQDGKTGILVDSYNTTAVTQAIIRLLENKDLRQKMGQSGRNWIETEMNWDRAGAEMSKFI